MKTTVIFLGLFFISVLTFGQTVADLTLINATTNSDIGQISDGDTINMYNTGTALNIRADVSGTVGSVVFGYDGNASYQTESVAPYAIGTDNSGDYNEWTPTLGNNTVVATPYSEASGAGTAGTALTVSFVVINEDNGGGTGGGTGYDPPDDPGTGTVTISGETKKWHKITLSFDGPSYSETSTNPNPHLDYRFNVTFTNGSKSYTVPGYFAADGNAGETSATSGNVWRVHFSPDETGTWNYSCSFRIGENIAVSDNVSAGQSVTPIDGKTDSFSVSVSDKSAPDLRAKGRLQYVGEHYLKFAETGEYFVKGGPDAPENFLAYEDFDNTPDNGGRRKSWSPHQQDYNTGDPSWKSGKGTEIIGAINYLASEGLNVFSFLTMNINGDDRNVYPYVNSSGFLHFDVSKLDQWGIVFDHAQTKGMYLHFKTQETENETLLDDGAVSTERKLYYRMLIARYGYHLALNWNLGEENNDQSDQQRKDMAQYFYDHDPYHHNIVIHTYPGQQENIYRPMLGSNSELTGVSIQIGWNSVHTETKQWVEESAAAGKKWVCANDEQGSANVGVPEDAYTGTPDKHGIRKETLWGNLMGGGAGVEYYFGYQRPESDLTCEDFRSRDISWDYVRYALNFFNDQVSFWQMTPDDDLVSSGWCLADEGNTYLVYLKDGGSTNLTINHNATYTVKWFDPRNGGALKDGSVTSISGTGAKSLGNAPNNTSSDWAILVVNSDGVNLAPNADISVNTTSGDAPLGVDFDGTGSSDSDGSISAYAWGFGDGGTGSGDTISYTYNNPGTYTATLTVTDNEGKSSSVTVAINVNDTGTTSCEAPFEEENGLVVVEIESVNPETGWTEETSVTGYTGDSYFRWTGGDNFNSPGSGTLTYKIKINTPGTYRFQWRNKVGHGTNSTEANDSWLKIPDADDFYGVQGSDIVHPKGECTTDCPEGAGSGGWFKVYLSGTTSWTWSSRTSDNDAHDIYADFNSAGVYTVLISGRSNDHLLDRFVLYKSGVSDATNTSNPETLCEDGGTTTKYTLTVTNGSGDGSYTAGTNVNITADAPASGKAFDTWTGDVSGIVNVNSANTTITMPSQAASITATYKDVTLLTSVAINVGGNAYMASDGTNYIADDYFTSGSSYTSTNPINGTTDDVLYQSERYGDPFSYAIPLANGNYYLTLKFAEVYQTATNERVLDVTVEGSLEINDLDIYAEAGKDVAYDVMIPVNISDGELNISLTASVDNAKLSAILVSEDIPTGNKLKSTEAPLKVYPTVTDGIVTVEGLSNENMQLMNTMGVRSDLNIVNESTINIDMNPAGLYLLVIGTRGYRIILQ